MTTNQLIKNPYTFNKTAWHCRLFNWCYGINPPDKFKTMCPYFWSFVGTLFILPFILIAKLARIPSKSIGNFVSNAVTACEDYKENEQIAKISEVFTAFKLLFYQEDIRDDKFKPELIEFENLRIKNEISWSDITNKLYDQIKKVNYITYWDCQEEVLKFRILITKTIDKLSKEEEEKKAAKIKKVDDIIIQVKENKILKFIILIISGICIGSIIVGIGYILYILAVELIVPNFILIITCMISGMIFIGCAFALYQFFKCWGETILLSIASFFSFIKKWLNKFIDGLIYILGYSKPLLKVFLIFIYISWGIVLIGKTIYAIYKQYCPIITWTEE